MHKKNVARIRRATKVRKQIRRLEKPRLTVHRTGRHLYAQVISADGENVVASASTVQKDLRDGNDLKATCNKKAAEAVGKTVAERAVAAGIDTVAFDRSGFKYHGRIKALADAAREGGLKF